MYSPGLPNLLSESMKDHKPYTNAWYPANEKDSFCKQIWEIGQTYKPNQTKQGKPDKRQSLIGVKLVSYFYLQYLMACRRGELLSEPTPTLVFLSDRVELSHRNFKHYTNRDKTKPEIVDTLIPYCCLYSIKMWKYISSNFQQDQIPWILDTKNTKWPGYNALSNLVKRHFILPQKNPDTGRAKPIGIAIHSLRHWRIYNLLIQHSYPPSFIQKYAGWTGKKGYEMIYYYASIRNRLSKIEQAKVLAASNLLVPRDKVTE